jgi:S1-C subfamily serine protease
MHLDPRAGAGLAAVALALALVHPAQAGGRALSSRNLWAHDANSIVKVSTYPSDLAAIFDTEISEGTGFFVQNGYIVTWYHVIQHAHVYIDVTLRNLPGTSYQGQIYHSHVVATDPAQDLALLRLNNRWDGPALPLGNPRWLRVGDPVAVFGHRDPGGAVVGVLESDNSNGWSWAVPITDLQTLAQTSGSLGRSYYISAP